MIDAKKAVEIASDFFTSFFPEGTFSGWRLEEIEHDAEQGCWLVLVSYCVEQPAAGTAEEVGQRLHKRFVIDDANGHVRAMRGWPVDSAA